MENKVPTYQSELFRGGRAAGVYVPKSASSFWDSLSSNFGQMADKAVSETAYKAGLREQTENAEVTIDADGNEVVHSVVADGANAYSVRARAYNKGANAAFISQKTSELDGSLIEMKQKFRNDPQGFKEEFNDNYLPKFMETVNSENAAGFRQEAMQRHNRVYSQLLTDQNANEDAQNQADITDRFNTLQADIFNLVASDMPIDPNTGNDFQKMIGEAGIMLDAIQEYNPALAGKLRETLQQQIRTAEWLAVYEQTPVSEREKFIEDIETSVERGDDLLGETLSPENRRSAARIMRQRFNRAEQNTKSEDKLLRNKLTSLEKALLSGAGDERALDGVIEEAYAKLDGDSAAEWDDRLTRAQDFSQELNTIKELSIPNMSEAATDALDELDVAKKLFNEGKLTAVEMNWETTKTKALVDYVNTQNRILATDAWLLMDADTAGRYDLTSPEGVLAARSYISEKSGLPLYRIAPMSKSQMDATKDDIQKTEDAVEKAIKLVQLKDRLGERQFFDVFTEMELDDALFPIAFASSPAKGAAMMQAVEEGALLEKRADTMDKDKIRKSFDTMFGNALDFDINRREKYYAMYQNLVLAYKERGSTTAESEAQNDILSGQRIISLAGGQKLLAPMGVDEDKIDSAMDVVRSEWTRLGLALPPGVTVDDVSLDNFSPQIYGNKLIFVDHKKQTLKVRGKNGNTFHTLQVDLETYDIDRAEQHTERHTSWGGPKTLDGKSIANTGNNAPAAMLDTIVERLYNVEGGKKHLDPAATLITNLPYEQLRLQGVAHLIRNGHMPSWLNSYMRQYPSLKLNNANEFEQLQKLWKDEANRHHTLPGGADASPLESLMLLVARIKAKRDR